jgi:hypothetical protein
MTEHSGSTVFDERMGRGDWLVRTAHPTTGGFRCLYPIQSTRFDYKQGQIYTFDSGVVLKWANSFRSSGLFRCLG